MQAVKKIRKGLIKKINLIPSLIAENKAAIEIFILQKFLYKPSNYQASLCSLKKLRGLSAPLRLDRFDCQRLWSVDVLDRQKCEAFWRSCSPQRSRGRSTTRSSFNDATTPPSRLQAIPITSRYPTPTFWYITITVA